MPNPTPLSNPANASDAQLVEAARLGNRKAFVEIVHRYQNLVTGVSLAILRDFALSEDAAQEAFVQAWQKIDTLKNGEKLRSWLCQIARNTALNHAKKRRLEDALEPSLVDPSPRPDELAISRDEQATVLSALNSLPEKYRLPLVLYYREDRSIKSVAEPLSQSEATVRKQLSRGRNLLKEQMTDLLKSTLPRTIPGPVFTATVAGLIGAMLKPTAVAATAFSAKPLAASASAMTTSKLTLTTAAIITAVCIPVGYTARALIPEKTVQAPVEITTVVPTSERQSYDPKLSPIALEWQALLASCKGDPKAFPDLYQTISEIPGSLRREAFLSLLIAEWVRLDPDNGLTFIRSRDHSGKEQRLFASEWIKQDINAAIDGLLRGGPGWDSYEMAQLANLKKGESWSSILGSHLMEVATRAPVRLKEIIEALPPEPYFGVQEALSHYLAIDPEAARELADSLTSERRKLALEGIARGWSNENFEDALTWAQSSEDEDLREALVRSVIISLIYRDPLEALEFLKTSPSEMKARGGGAIEVLAERDFPAALNWISQNNDQNAVTGLSSEFHRRLRQDPIALIDTLHDAGILKTTSGALFDSDILAQANETQMIVWNRLLELGDHPDAKYLRQEIIAKTPCYDPKTLIALVDKLPKGPERQDLAQEVAKKIISTTRHSSRLSQDLKQKETELYQMIQEAPQDWKAPLIEEAFKAVRFVQSDHLDEWTGYFETLPESERSNALKRLTWGIANHSPEKMTAFFSSLKSDDEKFQAGTAFVDASRRIDPEIGTRWLEDTPMDAELRERIRLTDPFQ